MSKKIQTMKKVKIIKLISCYFLGLLILGCQEQTTTATPPKVDQIEVQTKQLLNTFLDKEDLGELEAMLDESIKFHWPDKSVLDKAGLMNACRELTKKHDNRTQIIDIITEGNKSFVLFIWSGTVTEDANPKIVGKSFSIHDCYRLTWKDGKIVEWYTIWGSMDYLMQLGYTFTPPPIN